MNNIENSKNAFVVVGQTIIPNGEKPVLGNIVTPFTKPKMPMVTNPDGTTYLENNFFG